MDKAQADAIAEVKALREKISQADSDTLDLILRQARTQNVWTDKPVPEQTLRDAYDLAAMGATSMNCQPMRVIYVQSSEGKDRLLPHVMGGNQEKTRQAPVTAIVANDFKFYDRMAKVFPINPNAASMFEGNEKLTEDTAFRNGTLQAAYLMIALRAYGLDCGPMSGFDQAGVDAEFFAGTNVKSNFLINIGYADADGTFPRLPRLDFDAVSSIV